MRKSLAELFVRNISFGVEDSIVSTMGLLAGIAASGASRTTIVLTGVVLIFVEGFSMGIGSLLTEHSVAEFRGTEDHVSRRDVLGGGIMLGAYITAGLLPLLPYVFFPVRAAFWVSVVLSLLGLFLLGVLGVTKSNTHRLRHGLEMLIVGGIALAVGLVIGRVMHGLV
ncbi:MAG: VIT1/CCC1 transporter family protein [bacterium]|nr:VIT1/CCC1 transporter family protein [bacterium]